MYARATGPPDLWRHPPGKTTPLCRPKEGNPVKTVPTLACTPKSSAPTSPSSRAIVRYCFRSDGALLARCRSPGIDRQAANPDMPARHSAADCTQSAAHSVRTDLQPTGLCRSHCHDVHKLRRPSTPPAAIRKHHPDAKARRVSESGSAPGPRQSRNSRRRRASTGATVSARAPAFLRLQERRRP